MARKKATKNELESQIKLLKTELKLLKKQRNAGNVASVLNNFIKWAGLIAIAGFCYLSIVALSGKSTFADIGINLLPNVQLSKIFTFLFGFTGVGYGLRQRKLRRDTVERLQSRIKKLERDQDHGRTSSGLTPRGETHPKDM